MANPEHLEILKQGVEVWNRWRQENPDIRPDLREADLFQVNLNMANLHSALLSEAFLNEAFLIGADLSQAFLVGSSLHKTFLTAANLTGSFLMGASLDGANLNEADLTDASLIEASLVATNLNSAYLIRSDLRGADLTGSNLTKTKLEYATLRGTIFGDVDLSTVEGLDLVHHAGPSTIGIDTIYLSGGRIPKVFLRGSGVPDSFITLVTSLTNKKIEYYSCFICYSSKDKAFANRLYDDLQDNGVRCWFALEDMKIGEKIRPTIDQTIRSHDKLFIILSEHSINSEWVEQEVETAFEEERLRNQTALFPIRLDEALTKTNKAWAVHIRDTRHIGDFSRWKDPDSYQKAFKRLLRDLKSS